MFAEVVRRIPHFLKSIKREAASAELKVKITKKIKSLKKYFDEEEYLSSYILVKECVALITEFLIETDGEDKDYFRKLYLLDRKTALWWWFIQESSYKIYEASEDVVKIDILIALYFLARKSQL